MNRYERQLLSRLYIIKFLIILSSILNLVLPVYSKGLGYTSPLQYCIIITHIIGYKYTDFHLEGQKLCILPIFLIRLTQLILHGFLKWNRINPLFFIILILFDILIIILKFVDKLRMEVEYEEIDE